MKKALVLAIIILAGCSAQQSQIMSSTGKVILIRGCEVCVSYDVVNRSWADKSLGCFAHLNGHRYQVGDAYPDQEKHTTGSPVNCEKGADWNPAPIESLISDGGGFGGRKRQNQINRRSKRIQRKNGLGLQAEIQTGELA